MRIIRLAILKGSGGIMNALYDRGTTPWTLIGALGAQYDNPDILTFTNKALIADGYEVPWAYDGTTLAHLADVPGTGSVPLGACHHAVHQGFYWVWNTADTTGTQDGPSSLKSSDLNDPNSWPLANQIFVDKDDGDQGMGMGQFTIAESGISPTTTQVLFKTFAAYQMTGVFGSTNPAFSIQKVKTDMGCIAPRTIRFAPGFGLLRLTHRGVALFNGVDDTLISEEIRPLLFGNDSYRGIDWTTVGFSRADVIANPPTYVLFCPAQGPGLTQVFCYDLVRRAWVIFQYPFAVSEFEEITNPLALPTALVGDYSGGHVRSIFSPQDQGDDSGQPIEWSAALKPVSAPSPQQRGYYRRAVVKVFDNAAVNQKLYWVATFGPQTGTVAPPTKAGTLTLPLISPTVGAGPGFGLEPFGVFPFGSVAGGSGGSECDLTIDLGFIADNLRLVLSGQGQLTIRGIEYHVSGKPLTRPSVYA